MTAVSRLIGVLFVPIILSGTDKPQVTYLPKDKVDEAFSKSAPLVVGEKYRVLANHRDGPGQVEVHHLDTDVMYIVEGSATFVTGGTVVGGKTTESNEIRGTSISGGQTHHVSKGDVVVIPNDTPHWFQQVSPPFHYFVVKVR